LPGGVGRPGPYRRTSGAGTGLTPAVDQLVLRQGARRHPLECRVGGAPHHGAVSRGLAPNPGEEARSRLVQSRVPRTHPQRELVEAVVRALALVVAELRKPLRQATRRRIVAASGRPEAVDVDQPRDALGAHARTQRRHLRAHAQIGADLDLTVANDWAGISVALSSQQLDVAQMGPWGYVLAKQKGDAQAIAMLLIEGRDYDKAIVVARPDLKLARFPEDAKGMSMQMLDVGSTSGWLVPTHFMRTRGIDPKTWFGKYAEGASAAAAQMAAEGGQVDLATGWDTHRNTMLRNGQLKPESNRVVRESDRLPNEPVVVRRGFDPALAARLQAALANIPQDKARALMPWPYSGFVATNHQPYAVLEKMGREVGVLKA